MSESARRGPKLQFGVFEVDLTTGEVRKDGLKVRLQYQPFQVLALLLDRAGDVVTRHEFCQKIWPPDTHVDFDNSLKTAVNKLRQTLGDSADNPRFVETLARRGYRFIAPIREIPQAVSAEQKPRSERITLAVLPFDNLSRLPEQEYFTDGLTQETTTALGRLRPERLGVIARTSAMRYKRSDKGIDQIGRELGVDYILEGSVLRAAKRVRVNAELIHVNDQTHLWAEAYEQLCVDPFTTQKQLARRIARALSAELLAAQHSAA